MSTPCSPEKLSNLDMVDISFEGAPCLAENEQSTQNPKDIILEHTQIEIRSEEKVSEGKQIAIRTVIICVTKFTKKNVYIFIIHEHSSKI